MEASIGARLIPTLNPEPDVEKIKQRLLKQGVRPTPKIIHTLRKKEIQKANRKANKAAEPDQLTEAQKQAIEEDTHFLYLRKEYEAFNKAVKKREEEAAVMVGRPWEGVEKIEMKELEYGGEKLKGESLRELRVLLEERRKEDLKWVLEDDVVVEEGWLEEKEKTQKRELKKLDVPLMNEAEAIKFLVKRLSVSKMSGKDWKFGRMMKQSKLEFSEGQLLRIVDGLGEKGQWKHALSVVEWAYEDNDRKHLKSRFVYTKLLAVLGKARMPHEALRIFNLMCENRHLYPDMAVYHSISVTLGQSGFLKELLSVIEALQKPSAQVLKMRSRKWDPVLEPDFVVYNAVLNACVPLRQWKAVSWVFQQLRQSGLKPNGATYGLAMEVMLKSKKYELVHDYFSKMRKSGEAPQALSYKVLVQAFWEEGKIDEAVKAVRDMEQRGVVGTASVYYELVCCLCNYGRRRDAMIEVQKLKQMQLTKPLAVTFTGMIVAAMNGGYVDDCISIFEQMQDHCAPNVGTVNIMLKVYGKNDMFAKARELFEEMRRDDNVSNIQLKRSEATLQPDMFTYVSVLEASAKAHQWEYFECLYKEMALSGYQLDQSRHSSILVEASKAGKVHLLEHAFDRTLEAGEVPHRSYFIELICQAASQLNYERAITLIRTLGYAPTQLSEAQWADIFAKNEDQMSKNILVGLLDELLDADIPKEPTIINLLASLQSLRNSGDEYANISAMTCSLEQLPGPKRSNGISFSAPVWKDTTPVCRHPAQPQIADKAAVSSSKIDTFIHHLALDESVSDFDHSSVSGRKLCKSAEDDIDLDEYDNEKDDEDTDDLPSAAEILNTWKELRKRDSNLLALELGRNSKLK